MKKKTGISSLLICCVIFFTLPISSIKVNAQEHSQIYENGPYQVGYTDFHNITNKSGKWLPIATYYPAIESGENTEPILTDAPYPTIICSPGLTGSIESMRRLSERVASWGFILVIAGSELNAWETERSEDIIITLDWLEAQKTNQSFHLNELIDGGNYCSSGYSSGGYGAVQAAGRDHRIKAVVAIAAGPDKTRDYGVAEAPEDFTPLSVPILYIVGDSDLGGKRTQANLAYYNHTSPPKHIVVLTNVTHSGVHGITRIYQPIKYIVSFLKLYLCGESEYATHLYGESAQQDVDEGLIEVYYDINMGKDDFMLSNLVIDPISINVGESVTVSVDVENIGTKTGEHTIALRIDGNLIEEKTITVDEGLSKKVIFTYQADEKGSRKIEIENLEGSFKVVDPMISGFPTLACFVGLLLSIILLTNGFNNKL